MPNAIPSLDPGHELKRRTAALVTRVPVALTGDVLAVHRARVASRRVREALALAVAFGARAGAVRLERDVRRITKALGPVRELDVSLETLESAAELRHWPTESYAAIRRLMERERERRRARLLRRMRSMDVGAVAARMAKVVAAIDETRGDAAWRRTLAARVAQRADRAHVALRSCGTMYAPDRLHRLRIALKKLRYALELAGHPGGPAVRRAGALLRAAQQRFGDLHDAQMLRDHIAATSASGHGRPARAAGGALADDLNRECRERHARLITTFPELATGLRAIRRDAVAEIRGRRLGRAFARSRGTVANAS